MTTFDESLVLKIRLLERFHAHLPTIARDFGPLPPSILIGEGDPDPEREVLIQDLSSECNEIV